jgi:hypothetical protein
MNFPATEVCMRAHRPLWPRLTTVRYAFASRELGHIDFFDGLCVSILNHQTQLPTVN